MKKASGQHIREDREESTTGQTEDRGDRGISAEDKEEIIIDTVGMIGTIEMMISEGIVANTTIRSMNPSERGDKSKKDPFSSVPITLSYGIRI